MNPRDESCFDDGEVFAKWVDDAYKRDMEMDPYVLPPSTIYGVMLEHMSVKNVFSWSGEMVFRYAMVGMGDDDKNVKVFPTRLSRKFERFKVRSPMTLEEAECLHFLCYENCPVRARDDARAGPDEEVRVDYKGAAVVFRHAPGYGIECVLQFKKPLTRAELLAPCMSGGYLQSVDRPCTVPYEPLNIPDGNYMVVIGSGLEGSYPFGEMTSCSVCLGFATFSMDPLLYVTISRELNDLVGLSVEGALKRVRIQETPPPECLPSTEGFHPTGSRRYLRGDVMRLISDGLWQSGDIPFEYRALMRFMAMSRNSEIHMFSHQEALYARLGKLVSKTATPRVMGWMEAVVSAERHRNIVGYIYFLNLPNARRKFFEIGTLGFCGQLDSFETTLLPYASKFPKV